MIEQEWFACTDPKPMLDFLRDSGKASVRKLRLFACACVGRVAHLLTDQRSRAAAEVAQRFADGLASPDELKAAADDSWDAVGLPAESAKGGLPVSAWYAARAAAGVANSSSHKIAWDEALSTAWAAAAAAATAGLGWGDPVWDRALYAAYTAVGYTVADEDEWADVCWSEAPYEMGWDSFVGFPGWVAERKEQASLLRDILGNPFRLACGDPAWRTPAVVALARSCYEDCRFQDMPLLGDALEEAGCDHKDILDHCRGPGPHARGCWPVDVLLGKK